MSPTSRPLSHSDLLQLKRWNTPTIYNGWEQITKHNPGADAFNIEETRDFMPQMGPMVGYAVTLVIEPGNASHRQTNPKAGEEFRRYIASIPGPKIIVVQDLDKPRVLGSAWGEVSANMFRALGCVGTITDGAIRDLDEMTNAGFKALARRLCVGHAHVHPVRWNCEVEVFGRTVIRAISFMPTSTASWSFRPRTSRGCSKPPASWTATNAPPSSPPPARALAAARTNSSPTSKPPSPSSAPT
jgi:4-hydroxy-4-methyl-2-oxoglutarate aldolase